MPYAGTMPGKAERERERASELKRVLEARKQERAQMADGGAQHDQLLQATATATKSRVLGRYTAIARAGWARWVSN